MTPPFSYVNVIKVEKPYMEEFIIVKNAIRCKKCGEIIESTNRHNFVTCHCGACSVDGGHDYLRRVGNKDDWEDVSEIKRL